MGTVAITNVRVFDGLRLTEPRTVVLEDSLISARTTGDTVVDGNGAALLPGLIDSHLHIAREADLESASQWGLTTVLCMASADTDLTEALRHRTGLPALLSAGHPAFAPKGLGVKMGFPASSAVSGPADAAGFVADRIAQKADYIKVLIEDAKIPGAKPLRPETIHAIVVAAHRANLIVVAHVTSVATLTAAVEAGVDVIAHAAIDGPLGAEFQEKLKSQPVVLTPTLVTLRSIIEKLVNMRIVRFLNWIGGRQLDYSYAQASVKTFREAGMVVLAGSDANNNPAAPHSPPFGDSLHEELELLVEAGLSPVEALQSATSLPAKVFGLTDRGVIEAGRRADLVLVEGDPTVDIKATRAIKGVWIAGTRVR